MPMKSRFLLLLLTISSVLYAGRPWKMESVDPQEKVTLTIDLYEESVEVPGMEIFGLMNGYLGGNIYGVWLVTSFRIKGNRAILRLSNDLGSETQEAELVQTSDSTYMLELKGSVVVKRAVGRKLVKIAPTLKMFRRAR